MIDTIVCLLKRSVDYDLEYVERLMTGLRANINPSMTIEYVCMSDDDRVAKFCTYVPLPDNGFVGYWNKINLFGCNELKGREIMYFDLDTVIMKDITDILKVDYSDFTMLSDFMTGVPASGVMAWKGDYQYLFDEYDPSMDVDFRVTNSLGDQGYIAKHLRVKPRSFQQMFPGRICSYKIHPQEKYDASIVCFHGRPRPRAVNWDIYYQK